MKGAYVALVLIIAINWNPSLCVHAQDTYTASPNRSKSMDKITTTLSKEVKETADLSKKSHRKVASKKNHHPQSGAPAQ